MKLFHFLGSVTFAIILIGAALLFVVAGTWIESIFDSHLLAARYTYSNPFFLALLALFFINILFAALRRYPFSKRHIPFLMTHLGLLMVISGVVVKLLFGHQGNLLILEGSGSHAITLQNVWAIEKTTRDGKKEILSLEEAGMKALYPHHEKKFLRWEKFYTPPNTPWEVVWGQKEDFEKIYLKNLDVSLIDRKTGVTKKPSQVALKEQMLFVDNFPPVPLTGAHPLLASEATPFRIELKNRATMAVLGDELFLLYPNGTIEKGEESFIQYDNGFGGVGVETSLLKHSPTAEEMEKQFISSLGKAIGEVTKDVEQLSPPLQLLRIDYGDRFPLAFAQFLVMGSLTKDLSWEELPFEQLKSCYWAMILHEQYTRLIEAGKTREELTKEAPWKYLLLPGKSAEESLMGQLYQLGHELPEPPEAFNQAEQEKMFALFLTAYNLNRKTLLAEFPLPKESERVGVQGSLRPEYKPLPPLKKLEDNRPLVVLGKLPLGFDPNWQTVGPGGLYKFCHKKVTIPHHVRLRSARTIYYPNSEKPFSYECDLVVNGEEVSLSMNHVYETADGYRFYLSNISPMDETQAKWVQIAVNHDPAKWWLTYPGSALVALGILLLFWWRPKQN